MLVFMLSLYFDELQWLHKHWSIDFDVRPYE